MKAIGFCVVSALLASGLLDGCSQSAPGPGAGAGGSSGSSSSSSSSSSSGSSGSSSSGSSSGTASSGGTIGGDDASADDSSAGVGNDASADDSSTGPGGDDGGLSGGDAGGSASSSSGGSSGGPGTFPGWYEAEDVPPNQLILGTATTPAMLYVAKPGSICPPPAMMMPGAACFSGKGEVVQILGRYNRALQYNNVSAPSDGMYDVTWWYHCGLNDNFGDKDCGGQTNPPTTASGCRPHNLVVNGTPMPGTYHFPCFSGSWTIIRAATTTLPLKAGSNNSIKVYSTAPRDAADLDAIAVNPAGKGMAPTLTSNMDPLGH